MRRAEHGTADAIALALVGLVVGYGVVSGQIALIKGIEQLTAVMDDEASAAHCGAIDEGDDGCILPPSDHERGADGALCALKAHVPLETPWPEGLPPCA